MYAKYYTDGFVIKSADVGEADKVVHVYTRDFGLVHARARAVRTESSRMRYALQVGYYASLGLVRGKAQWRVAGALASAETLPRVALSSFMRIASLVARLVHGEERNDRLFAVLDGAYEALAHHIDRAPLIELVAVARMLNVLGYLSRESLDHALVGETTFDITHMTHAEEKKNILLSSVNRALSETHLL